MSLPSPNGSTSSIVSSEDSSSAASTFSTKQTSSQQQYEQYPLQLPSTSSSSSSSSFHIQSGSSKPLKLCRVCGDRAKSYHFGGISCDSCKAFFRRSVQNDGYRNFHCPYEGHCEITITSRKCCQFCRFQKCISIGMEKSWVMTEEERMQMLKNRMEKKKQQEDDSGGNKMQVKFDQSCRMKSKYEPELSQLNNYLTDEEVKTIENVMNVYGECINEISFPKCDQMNPTRTEVLNLFFTAIQQFALFAQRLESFNIISHVDQQVLLRGGVLELCFIRGAFLFNTKEKCWHYKNDPCCVLFADNLEVMITQHLLEKQMNFIKTINKLKLDETTSILIAIIVLLTPDRTALINSRLVQKEQEKYLLLLKNYMNWRYGAQASSLLYPKLLLKLTDLRELAEAHTDYQLLLCKEELEEIQQRLSSLHIDITCGTAKREDNLQKSTSFPNSSWSINKCLAKKSWGSGTLFADEELSTSSEGSENCYPQIE